MELRQQVFVVEQKCVYLDADGLDTACIHGLASSNATLVAYARILPPGLAFDAAASIGRVVTHPSARGTGLGRALVAEALRETQHRFPTHDITIGAQAYLRRFYEAFGFAAIGEPYDEDGIMHIHMTRAVD